MATFALLILGSRQLALAGEVCLAFLSRELKEEEKVASVVGVAYALDAMPCPPRIALLQSNQPMVSSL